MSFDSTFSFSFGPTTPPHFSYEEALKDASFTVPHHSYGHSRSSSHASMAAYSQESSPEYHAVHTAITTPARSPIRSHGPLLLPKIRPQDQEIESPPKRFKNSPATKVTKPFRPSHTRSYTNPETISFMSSASHDNIPSHTRSMSTLCSPITFTNTNNNERRASSADVLEIDNANLSKYSYPTYRHLPTYIPSSSSPQIATFMPATLPIQSYAFLSHQQAPIQRTPSPLQNTMYLDDMTCVSPIDTFDTDTSTLMTYLTSPNPAPALVRQLNIHVRDSNTKHFWWDIRQIRPWTSFSTATISSIPGLHALLSISLPTSSFPVPGRTSTQPETEAELASIYNTFYASKLNAALFLSQGTRHLVMRQSSSTTTKGARGTDDPTFLSAYTDDTSALIYGRGLGRVVGLVKSFDRWNTGMRVEGNHRKVEYLRGLAHLHHHMRAHGCRYGFIMTEIELVVVRNGAEATPHFGYLEIQTIQLAAHSPTPASTSTSSSSSTFEQLDNTLLERPEPAEVQQQKPKMTALLALWYLHMLARDDPLPGQVGWKSEIGAPAEGTRRKTLPKDEWIPEPQLAEKREGKRGRGWVWPEEAVGRKELGKRGVRY